MRGEPAVHPGRRRRALLGRGRGPRPARRGPRRLRGHVAALVARGPHVTLDDGADLLAVLHARQRTRRRCCGGTEETTTGLVRLRALEPRAARLPGHRGQRGAHRAPVQRPLRHRPVDARRHPARDEPAAGRARRSSCSATATTGQGHRARARGAGAQVVVCEVDPMRALEARMEGFEVMPALDARRARRRLHHRDRARATSCAASTSSA